MIETEGRSVAPEYKYALRYRVLDGAYDALFALTMPEPELRRAISDALRPLPAGRLLDLGAGTGSQLVHIARTLPAWRLIGLDGDQNVLARARRKAAHAGASIEWLEGLADELPFEDRSLDAVVRTMMFHHLDRETKRKALAEIRRVLRPGGRFLLLDFGPPASFWTRLSSPVWQRLDGSSTAADNFSGALPRLMGEAGLPPTERFSKDTLFGTVRLWEAVRPAA